MSRRGVSKWMFLLVPAHPGRPGQRAVKRSRVCVCVATTYVVNKDYHSVQRAEVSQLLWIPYNRDIGVKILYNSP